jgi:hypothetical protein
MATKTALTALVLLTVFVVCASFPNALLAQEEPIGKVTALTGKAEAKRAGETEWVALKLNDAIYFKDTIRTAEKTRVQILMEDDSLLNLGEDARLTIREHIYQPDKDRRSSLFSLTKGKVRVLVGKAFGSSDSSFGVETPTSVIGIRLTQFIVWVVSQQLTTVVTLDGEVLAKNVNPAVVCDQVIGKNYSSQIPQDSCPTTPVEVPAEEIEQILLDTDVTPSPPAADLPLASKGLSSAVAEGLGEDVEIDTPDAIAEGEVPPAEQPIDQEFGTTTDDEIDRLEDEAPGVTTSVPARPRGELPEPPRPPTRLRDRRIFRGR